MVEDGVALRLAMFRQALALGGEEREQFLNLHPELYADEYYPAVLAAADRSRDTVAIRSLVNELARRVGAWRKREADFIIGYAPYEILFFKVDDGVLDQQAAQRAASATWAPAEADTYLNALGALARRMVPKAALSLLGIVRAAVAARPGGPMVDDSGPEIELRYLRAAAGSLRDDADGRLYRAALAAGEAVLAEARRREAPELEVDALIALGSLCTNPYMAGRTSRNLESELYQWQRRFWESHRDELVDADQASWEMPPAAESLRRGAQFYRQAAELMSGHDRGLALKATFQSLVIATTLGETIDRTELARTGRTATELIDPNRAPSELVALLANLNALGETVDLSVLDALLEPSLDWILRDHGASAALDFSLNIVPLLNRVAPDRAEGAATAARALVDLTGQSWARVRQWSNELESFVWARVPGGFAGLPDGPVAAGWRVVTARVEVEGWDPASHAAALIGLAGRSVHEDDETTGLALLDEAERLAPVWCLDHRQALDFQRATLRLGLGVNAFNAKDWATAIEEYSATLAVMCNLNLAESALDVLARINDLVGSGGHDGAVQAVIGIAPFAVAIENLAGDPATWYIQTICRETVAALVSGGPDQGVNPEALLVVLQVAKGLRFAGLLLSQSRFRWREDDRGRRLLANLAEAERELPGAGERGAADPDQPVDENILLAAYSLAPATDNSAEAPDLPADHVVALRRTYDSHLSARLLTDAHPEDLVFLGSEAICRALDERTVLIDIYLGASPQGNLAIYTVATTSTRTRAACVVVNFPVAEVWLGDDQRSARGTIMMLVVAELRRKLMESSEPDVLTPDARDQLETLLISYLQGVNAWLDEWRAEGKDHLCFVPHGPLHIAPLHLMHHRGRPLAQDWTVTMLPNHALLLDERGGATVGTRRGTTLTAFGMSYPPGNPQGLPPLTHAVAEANVVAGVFGTAAVINDEATVARFLEALSSSRYLHLAAHGRYDVNAPWFHCVYLAPDSGHRDVDRSDGSITGGDGRLRAHELTSLDLRGTELVTLSACETSLGGMDSADNARGLPAALFLAGVRSIVGTLWEVRSDTTAFFFETLYEEIRAGARRHYAFSAAQRRTREQYPVYRDWGAFCFLGGWE